MICKQMKTLSHQSFITDWTFLKEKRENGITLYIKSMVRPDGLLAEWFGGIGSLANHRAGSSNQPTTDEVRKVRNRSRGDDVLYFPFLYKSEDAKLTDLILSNVLFPFALKKLSLCSFPSFHLSEC